MSEGVLVKTDYGRQVLNRMFVDERGGTHSVRVKDQICSTLASSVAWASKGGRI